LIVEFIGKDNPAACPIARQASDGLSRQRCRGRSEHAPIPTAAEMNIIAQIALCENLGKGIVTSVLELSAEALPHCPNRIKAKGRGDIVVGHCLRRPNGRLPLRLYLWSRRLVLRAPPPHVHRQVFWPAQTRSHVPWKQMRRHGGADAETIAGDAARCGFFLVGFFLFICELYTIRAFLFFACA